MTSYGEKTGASYAQTYDTSCVQIPGGFGKTHLEKYRTTPIDIFKTKASGSTSGDRTLSQNGYG